MSYGLWQSRFAGEPSVVGKSVNLDGAPARVIGVLPADFELPTLAHADLLVPEALREGAERQRLVRPLALLKPGVTVEQARRALEPLFQRFLESVPPEFKKALPLRLQFLRERQIQDARVASWILLGSVMAVLLIACANVAGLLLATAGNGSRDLAVRVALGASRMRIIRERLTESVLLACVGGATGCALAKLLMWMLVSIAPEGILRLQQATLDARVLLFALAASVVSGILFGIAPGFQMPRLEMLTGSRAVGISSNLVRQSLVTAEFAISLILLIGAGLLMETLWKLENARLGIQTENVVTASFILSKERHSQEPQQLAFLDELENRLRRFPGLTVAISDSLPPSGITRSQPFAALAVPGRPRFQGGMGGTVVWRYVTPGYFAALNIPILRGRGFKEEDRNPGDQPIILSQSLAARLFPNEDPVGKHVETDTVVGVAGDVNNEGLSAQPDPEYYHVRKHVLDEVFGNQMPPYGWRRASVVIRSSMNLQTVTDLLRSQIAALDPMLPLTIETMNQKVSRLAQRPRFNALLLGLFAGMGVLLAAIGLYGLISFLVAQRTQEIGVRMALGATPSQIARLVLGQAVRWALAGTVIGVVGSFWAMRTLATLLFELPENDLMAISAAIAVLIAASLVAACMPARRAALVDPMFALRHD